MEGKPQGSHGSGHGVWGDILGKGQRRSGDGAERDPKSHGVTTGSCPVSPGHQRGQALGRSSLAWLPSSHLSQPSSQALPCSQGFECRSPAEANVLFHVCEVPEWLHPEPDPLERE